MKRIMYVLQNEDGCFYWKNDTSFTHGLNKDFETAYLFKTKWGAAQQKKLPCYSKCTIREVEIKLVEK